MCFMDTFWNNRPFKNTDDLSVGLNENESDTPCSVKRSRPISALVTPISLFGRISSSKWQLRLYDAALRSDVCLASIRQQKNDVTVTRPTSIHPSTQTSFPFSRCGSQRISLIRLQNNERITRLLAKIIQLFLLHFPLHSKTFHNTNLHWKSQAVKI